LNAVPDETHLYARPGWLRLMGPQKTTESSKSQEVKGNSLNDQG
jgi:hypothetical protein